MLPLVLQMRQIIRLLLLSRVVFRLSVTGCMYDSKLLQYVAQYPDTSV